jgi:hypothetical protein
MCKEVIQGFVNVHAQLKISDTVAFEFKEGSKKGRILGIAGSIVKVLFEDGTRKFINLEHIPAVRRKDDYSRV